MTNLLELNPQTIFKEKWTKILNMWVSRQDLLKCHKWKINGMDGPKLRAVNGTNNNYCYFTCIICNYILVINSNEYYGYFSGEQDKLTCSEIVIKNIIE